jgi:hypothetical protein
MLADVNQQPVELVAAFYNCRPVRIGEAGNTITIWKVIR